ncbi:alpha/beta hydrolase [Paenibacillus frigoriresistens]|uniref:alpha/beta fold hydrolase n=1 Tax=Paenibacillus alginolyticus TaxID=59839 RepID=UPI001564E591|nr:alpha/beta hydrolase [Paenibacillus frigoriresistens]NRF94483.1 alpha/beta hydrolase [Paenibacillus frigoriresistens]
MVEPHFALNQEVRLHYLVSSTSTANTPLVYIPGMLGSAEEFFFSAFDDRECTAISLRGRGKSDSPKTGYTFNDHVADIEAVVSQKHIDSDRFVLMAFSRGAAYAMGFASQRPERLKGLIICDFPAKYPVFSTEWLERCLANPHTNFDVVQAIFDETEEVDLWDQLKAIECPVLVIRGGKEGSFLSEADAMRYQKQLKHVEIVVFEDSGHALWEPDEARFRQTIQHFLEQIDGHK